MSVLCGGTSSGGIPTQGLNPDLPHCRWILYQLSHKASPGHAGKEGPHLAMTAASRVFSINEV